MRRSSKTVVAVAAEMAVVGTASDPLFTKMALLVRSTGGAEIVTWVVPVVLNSPPKPWLPPRLWLPLLPSLKVQRI